MISYLKGIPVEILEEKLTLDVSGVGYELNCSINTADNVRAQDGLSPIWVHTHVREDDISLFGFSDKTEKQLFLALIKVTGIGPKMAIKILSGASLEQLVEMIDEGDVKGLTKLPKVGKKTAEQMILSLKGKLVTESTEPKSQRGKSRDEVVSALVNLGFKLTLVEQVVDGFDEEIDVQTGVRKGLAMLTSL